MDSRDTVNRERERLADATERGPPVGSRLLLPRAMTAVICSGGASLPLSPPTPANRCLEQLLMLARQSLATAGRDVSSAARLSRLRLSVRPTTRVDASDETIELGAGVHQRRYTTVVSGGSSSQSPSLPSLYTLRTLPHPPSIPTLPNDKCVHLTHLCPDRKLLFWLVRYCCRNYFPHTKSFKYLRRSKTNS